MRTTLVLAGLLLGSAAFAQSPRPGASPFDEAMPLAAEPSRGEGRAARPAAPASPLRRPVTGGVVSDGRTWEELMQEQRSRDRPARDAIAGICADCLKPGANRPRATARPFARLPDTDEVPLPPTEPSEFARGYRGMFPFGPAQQSEVTESAR